MYKMDPMTRQNVIHCLTNQYRMQLLSNGTHYKKGVCPQCGERKLWAFADNPWTIQCDRMHKCGYSAKMNEVHPELFATVTERAERELPKDPRGIAKLYLQDVRGLNITRIGDFYQNRYTHKATGETTATVRFPMPKGSNNSEDGWWERLVEEVDDAPKNNIKPGYSYRGLAWLPPGFDPKAVDKIWIVEGIFDALALMHHGITAISVISCRNFPGETLDWIQRENPMVELVFAYDSDPDGKAFLKRHLRQATDQYSFPKIRAAISGSDQDWNDLHLNGSLTESDLKHYLYLGGLLTARTKEQYALIMWARKKWTQFFMEFDYKTYWCKLNAAEISKKQQEIFNENREAWMVETMDELSEGQKEYLDREAFAANNSISEIASCTFDFLYSEKDLETEESFFYLQVNQSHKSTRGVFTSSHMGSASEFKKGVINTLPGASFTGSTKHLDSIYTDKAFKINEVSTIQYVGYCPNVKAYIYQGFAVKDGRHYLPNDEDYYVFENTNIKSKFELGGFNPVLEYKNTWRDDFITSFGVKGVVALSWWLGSLFAEQIRARYMNYPFIEITGDAGAGKSTLLEFLWKLIGRAQYEGFNPTNSTRAGRSRMFNQVSNLPIVFIEGDTATENNRSKQGGNWIEETKPLYNGRSDRVTGQKNMGNQTNEVPFRGALVISQNAQIQASTAVLSRIIYIHFDKSHHSPVTRQSAQRIERLDVEEVSGFLLHAITHEESILKLIDQSYEEYRNEVMNIPGIETERVGHNHAILLSLLDALCKLINIDDATRKKTRDFIMTIAYQREQDLKLDHPYLEQFWDVFEYLEDEGAHVNHYLPTENQIAFNLNEVYEVARNRGQDLEDIKVIRGLIQKSTRYEYVENKPVKSVHSEPKSTKRVRCFIFKRTGGKE